MKIRSFLAFDIPDEVKKNLKKLVQDFREKERGVKWSNVDNLHVTMKFFGHVEEEMLMRKISPRLDAVTKGFGPSTLECEGIGAFPNWKYPRVIWAGFTGDTEKVINLQKMIESTTDSFDVHKDHREFKLHLTLGRAKRRLRNSPLVRFVEQLGPVKFGKVDVNTLVLYKSVLTKTGPIYTPLREFRL